MRAQHQTGFLVEAKDVRNDILIPRYYDPRIADELSSLGSSHTLVTLDQLIQSGAVEHSHGSYVPKLFYGTGPYPYIRTSDLSNWEIRASPKHGVSADVFETYSEVQDVRPNDILFVHEGTYLIGTAALVSQYDGPMLYQHHLAKFRVKEGAQITAEYLLAAIASPLVQKQIRARQFSADIIDSVVGRLGELTFPIPRDAKSIARITSDVRRLTDGRALWRERMTRFLPTVERWFLSGELPKLKSLIDWEPDSANYDGESAFLGDRQPFSAFTMSHDQIVDDILIPKYYDPTISSDLEALSSTCDLRSVSSLVASGHLRLSVGDEIGRLSYGTGDIPFVRTSDLGTYELKADAKQGISQAVYDGFAAKQDTRPGDILLVRDGTYLVGSTSLVLGADLPLLFCGGMYKVRCSEPEVLSPGLCYALLNLPIVKRQMRSKQFTRDVIDTLGQRLNEVVLPIPRDPVVRQAISQFVTDACDQRVSMRSELDDLCRVLFE